MPTLYWKNAAGDYNWNNDLNWFTNAAGTTPAVAVPWAADNSYKTYDLAKATGQTVMVAIVGASLGNGFTITGTCFMDGVENQEGTIYGGTYAGTDFQNAYFIHGGTFTGARMSNSGTVDGGTFTGADFVNAEETTIIGGTFSGPGFKNNGILAGGVITGPAFYALYRGGFGALGSGLTLTGYNPAALDVLATGLL